MGSFQGHFLNGVTFVVFGLWWTVNLICGYQKTVTVSGSVYTSSVTFPCPCLCQRLRSCQIEGAVKVATMLVAAVTEMLCGIRNGEFVFFGNAQHATMMGFFLLSGVVDLLLHYKLPLPQGIDYVILTLAFCVEAFLFAFHLHDRTPMDVQLHTFLIYAIYGCIIATLLEMYFRSNILAALCRAYFTLLQGTWLIQMGFVLYNPLPASVPWNEHDHDQLMLVTMMFAWHMAGIIILTLAAWMGFYLYYRSQHVVAEVTHDRMLWETQKLGYSEIEVESSDESDLDTSA